MFAAAQILGYSLFFKFHDAGRAGLPAHPDVRSRSQVLGPCAPCLGGRPFGPGRTGQDLGPSLSGDPGALSLHSMRCAGYFSVRAPACPKGRAGSLSSQIFIAAKVSGTARGGAIQDLFGIPGSGFGSAPPGSGSRSHPGPWTREREIPGPGAGSSRSQVRRKRSRVGGHALPRVGGRAIPMHGGATGGRHRESSLPGPGSWEREFPGPRPRSATYSQTGVIRKQD